MKFALYNEDGSGEYSFELDMTLDQFEEWADTQDFESPWTDPETGRTRMLVGNHYADFVSEQEEHGVLDIGGDDDTEAYHSYEIEPEMYPVILENFRQFFINKGLPVKMDS